MTTLVKAQRIWSAQKKFGQAIGDIVARVVLTVFYFSIFVPFGVGVFSDPLQLKPPVAGVSWQPRGDADASLEAGRRQY